MRALRRMLNRLSPLRGLNHMRRTPRLLAHRRSWTASRLLCCALATQTLRCSPAAEEPTIVDGHSGPAREASVDVPLASEREASPPPVAEPTEPSRDAAESPPTAVDAAHPPAIEASIEAALPAQTMDAAASPDATPSSGSACPSHAQVCDDFEDGNLDGWTKLESGGTFTIDGTHVVSGKNALSLSIPAGKAGGFLERTGAPLFPLPNSAMFGRVMVYFDSVVDGHSDIVRGAPKGGGTPWYNVGEQHGQILLNYYAGAAADCWARPSPSKAVPARKWMCWEWSFDGAKNEMQFFMDGQLLRKVSAKGDGCLQNSGATWTAPKFESLRIGEYVAEISSTPTRIWLDDIAVSTTERVACPAQPAP